MMRRPDDETLMAYADGALPIDEVTSVETALRLDVEARRRVVMFRRSAAIARLAFEEPMWADTPPRLVRTVEETGARGSVVQFPLWRRISAQMRRIGPRSLACACVVATFIVAYSLHEPGDGPDLVAVGAVEASSPIGRALELFDRGHPGDVDSRFKLVATFKDRRGQPCQEIDILDRGSPVVPSAVLIACRLPDASWSIVGAVGPRSPDARTYVDTDTAAHEALSSVLTMMGATHRSSKLDTEPESRKQ